MNKIKELYFTPQFIKFLIIGGINTLSGTIFSLILMIFLQINIAFVISYALSLTLAYFLNTFFVFKQKIKFEKYLRFCLSYLPNFIINNAVVIIIYNILGWHRYIAIIGAAAIGMPVTYLFIKLFAFKK
jgi:putative flippase GtrA